MIEAKILADNNVLIYLFLQGLMVVATVYALFFALKIVRFWDFSQTSQRQYGLEKRSYLLGAVIVFIVLLKLVSYVFFAYTINGLSALIPGAMCAAGVIESYDRARVLLAIKLFSLLLGGLWIVFNRYDLSRRDYPLMRQKSALFVFFAAVVLVEGGFDLAFFSSLSTAEPVSCCTDIYGASGSSDLPFGMDVRSLLIGFYLSAVLTVAASMQKNAPVLFMAGTLFLVFSYYSVVQFFGTYIYQEPTHKCPFCMLQKEYHSIGYLIWGTLFAAVFSALGTWVLQLFTGQKPRRLYRAAALLTLAFTLLCSYFVVSYYIINGVFL
ncbi:MAG: hypothetical protein ACQERK_03240 [Campylobacterota bacterium]